jgi:hypothetical protein
LDSLPKKVTSLNQETENSLFEAIIVLLSTFSYTDEGIDQSEENFAKLAGLRSKIKELVQNAGLSELTTYFMERVEFTKGLINDGLDTRSIEQSTIEDIEAGQSSIEQTVVESLDEASSEITSEILNTFTFMMIAGATRALIEDALEDLIIGTQSKLGIVSSVLNTKADIMFSSVVRSYAMMIYTALGYDNFKYEGGLISDSRPFCVERNGNDYTTAQIAEWADLPDWRGRMPGTNTQTIFYYLGGYRCRHWLVPIKKENN